MAKDYKVGERYYLPVKVIEVVDDTYTLPVRFSFEKGDGCTDGMNAIKSEPNLLLTAEEVAKANGLYTSPCDERYDAQVDLVTARAAIDHLQEENKDLKRRLEIAEAARDGAIDESLKRKNRVTTMEEVIVALVEKIRRLKVGET